MNAQQLRNSILQEAIEGRLVPQDPNDEPASVLLERIREEKKRLVKEGKLKKKDLVEIPISEEEKPFDIPDSWEWVRHNDLFNISGGYQPPKSLFSMEEKEGYIRLYQIRDYGETPVPVYIPISCASKITQKDDILLARYGGSLGKVFLAEDGAYNVAMAKVEYLFNKQLLNHNYLFYYYKCNLYQDLVRGNNRSAQGGFNKEDLGSLLFPLPPLAEQKRIVAKIEELMPKVEEYGKAQEALDKLNNDLPERLKKSILQEAIEGRLVPQDPNDEPASALLERIREEKKRLVKEGRLKKKDLVETPISEDEKPFDIPESWEWCRISSFAAVLGGKRIPAGRKLTEKNTGHIYIRVSDMKEDTVSKDNLLYVPEDIYPSIARYIINKDDVYITVAGTIGRVGKIPPELNGANLTENADRLIFSNINQDWLIRCLQSHFIQMQISDVTTKVGQPKLAILRIQNLFIPLPPLAEQKRIVEKIEQLFAEIDKLKA